MAILVTLKGPGIGRQFPVEPEGATLGRHVESAICLENQAVSRQHARITCEDDAYFVEDLNSSNGTYLNGQRVRQRVALTEQDMLQIGPYTFGLRRAPVPTPSEGALVIRDSVHVDAASLVLQGQDTAHKLQVVLEIARQLGRTLEFEPLLQKFIDQVMQLFPLADRGMVILCQGERFVVRAQQCRDPDGQACPYSRTIVRRALDEGIGILSEDARIDPRFQSSHTLTSLDLRTVLCVPLIGSDGRRLGVVQLDRFRSGGMFHPSDLQLLTAVCLQVALVLENAALHSEVLREERLRQEVAFAREIQESLLPTDFPRPGDVGFEVFACVRPAREVSGDFYDFFPLPKPPAKVGPPEPESKAPAGANRFAFFVGDVSGKGMPAALFMVAVRVLGRHLASPDEGPAQTLAKLNAALAADNPAGMFVTLVYGIYDATLGEVVLTSAGHPPPFVRRRDGRVDTVEMRPGRLLGYEDGDLHLTDVRLTLTPGETLILYTDGCFEPRAPDGRTMFGMAGLQEALGGAAAGLSLEACADLAAAAVQRFTGAAELQDDLTLFLLRRV